jgi:hypothetical protein
MVPFYDHRLITFGDHLTIPACFHTSVPDTCRIYITFAPTFPIVRPVVVTGRTPVSSLRRFLRPAHLHPAALLSAVRTTGLCTPQIPEHGFHVA